VVAAQLERPATEAEALAAIKLATNPTLKLTAVEDFIARFPNSRARLSIAQLIAAEILKIRDGAIALALLQRAQAIFTSEQEREVLKPTALEAYAIGRRFADVFALASELLAKDPDDLSVLVRINTVGIDQSVKVNRKYAEVSLQCGLKAIAIIESGNKPETLDDEAWAAHKADLHYIYRNTAILQLVFQHIEEAKALCLKASRLVPDEPSHFFVLGMAADLEYTSQLDAYKAMAEGESKRASQKKLDALLDSVIDAFARAVGLATGRPQYQDMMQVLVPNLTLYYKTRHNESTEGLRQLINKYRLKP
jgi:hypothetical protein